MIFALYDFYILISISISFTHFNKMLFLTTLLLFTPAKDYTPIHIKKLCQVRELTNTTGFVNNYGGKVHLPHMSDQPIKLMWDVTCNVIIFPKTSHVLDRFNYFVVSEVLGHRIWTGTRLSNNQDERGLGQKQAFCVMQIF